MVSILPESIPERLTSKYENNIADVDTSLNTRGLKKYVIVLAEFPSFVVRTTKNGRKVDNARISPTELMVLNNITGALHAEYRFVWSG